MALNSSNRSNLEQLALKGLNLAMNLLYPPLEASRRNISDITFALSLSRLAIRARPLSILPEMRPSMNHPPFRHSIDFRFVYATPSERAKNEGRSSRPRGISLVKARSVLG